MKFQIETAISSSVLGWIVFPQKRHTEVVIPSTSECDPIWKYGLYRSNQVKMRSLGWALIQYYWCPCEKGESGHRDGHIQKKDDVKRHGEKMTFYKPRNPWGYQKLREAWNSTFRRSVVLLTPWYQTSGLQNCETINFCCSKLSSCAMLLWWP